MYRNIDRFVQSFSNGGGVGFERGRGSMYDSYPGSKKKDKEEEEKEERSFPNYGPPSVSSPSAYEISEALGGGDGPSFSFPDYSPPSVSSGPSAYEVSEALGGGYQNLPLSMGQPVSFDQGSINTNVSQPDYSGDVDRYSIPVGEYIPEDLGVFEPFVPPNWRFNPRAVADSLGLTDLSNFNPITGLMRGRDAAARIFDPERYSPTGQAEIGDYVEAGIETAIPALTMGLGSALRQPIKQTIGNVFGLDMGNLVNDMGNPVGVNVPMTSDTMRLYHGTEYDFLPSLEVTMPDGRVKRLDDSMFDRVSPLGMQFLREGMDVSETPFARIFEQLGYPKGTKITRVDPYGRFSTDYIGTGEGGYTAGSEGAQKGAGGAMVGKGIYTGQRPNIAQSYRYSNTNSGLPFVPYEDSFKDGVGQKTIEEAQAALADKYGDIETAREVFEAGTDPNFGEITPNMVFEYTSPAEVQDKWLADRNRTVNDVSQNNRLMSLLPEYSLTPEKYFNLSFDGSTTVSPDNAVENKITMIKRNFDREIRQRLDKLDPEMQIDNIKVQLRRPYIADSAKATLSLFYDDLYSRKGITPPNDDRNIFKSQEEFDQTVEDVVFLLDKERQFSNEILAAQNDMLDSMQANDDLAKVVNFDLDDIPGNLYISEIETGDLGRSLETNQPIDLGTLNDMVEIFGKEGVEDMFDRAGFPLKPGNIGREGLVELSDDPRGFKYAVPEFTKNPNLKFDPFYGGNPTEKIFAPRTVDEMNQLARGGYSNLRFLDAASRNDSRNPTYNYVFFGEDVMPKIVDRKQDGGLVGLGLGSV
jgi:hypothetical protein